MIKTRQHKRTQGLALAIALAVSGLLIGGFTAGAEAGPVIYNDFYNHFNDDSSLEKDGQNPPDDVASWAYAANSADAFGGVIGFDQSDNELATFSVIMSNWNGYDPTGGSGTATAAYDTDLTLELYKVDRTGTDPGSGDLIHNFTKTQSVPKRQIPNTSNASFVGNGTDFVVEWDLGGREVADEELLFMVRVDELAPDKPVINPKVNLLNIAAAATGTNPDVTAGTDPDNGVYWRSEGTGGEISRFEAGQVFARVTAVPSPTAAMGGLMLLGGLALRRRRRVA